MTAGDDQTTEADECPTMEAVVSADGDESTRRIDLDDPSYYLNRELSELAFQRRVLHEARDPRNPPLERVRFLSILTRNLDEFVMKRVGGLKQQLAVGMTDSTPDGRTPREQWVETLSEVRTLLSEQTECYHGEIWPVLSENGIEIVGWEDLDTDRQAALREYVEESVLPTLTPLSFDPAHPFPFISNLSLSLAVLTRREGEEPTFSRVKIPGNRPRLVPAGEGRFVLLEELIAGTLDLLFPDVEIVDVSTFRVTRNAEVRRNEEVAEDLIDRIEAVLRERRFATVVRLEVESTMPERVRTLLAEQLHLDDREVVELPKPLGFEAFATLTDLDRPELKLEPWTPQPLPRLLHPGEESRSIFEVIAEGDLLVHHPYHSFEATVQRFFDEAVTDPDVLAIKAAIYRTASDSRVIGSLIEAARNGKQVAAMVELKARFDERANLEWVKKLEEEGIHVAYGTIGYKAHSKTALVVREEADGVRLYSHVGTGNYHSETAKSYTDLGLLTADRAIGRDLVQLFNFFTAHSMHDEYRKLLVAPETLRESLVELIRAEAERARDGGEGRIIAKMNRLEDPEIVRELYAASRVGVEIDLAVRDICRLRPGLEGVSESIRVRSIVGRFLEHSRVFRFGSEPTYYIGSADWMSRNLDNRVEAVAPVEDPDLAAELESVLDGCLADDRRAWEMRSDGSYTQHRPADEATPRSVQDELMSRTRERASTRRETLTERKRKAPRTDEDY
jgi:polyphosphate kinase